jgi:hypothetical protein
MKPSNRYFLTAPRASCCVPVHFDGTVRELHGQPCSRTYRNTFMHPAPLARSQVSSFHGHSCPRALNPTQVPALIGVCPKHVRNAVHSFQAAVVPNPPEHRGVPPAFRGGCRHHRRSKEAVVETVPRSAPSIAISRFDPPLDLRWEF